MDLRFLEYGDAVCKFVRHATKTERAAIQRELAGHLEDHAEALMDAGCQEEDAYQMALASMGDPEEIGRALNKEYPLGWLVLARAGTVLIAVLAVLLVFQSSLFWPFLSNIRARTDPARYFQSSETMLPMDQRYEVPGGTILQIYGTDVRAVAGGYRASVYTVLYHKNPFRAVGYPGIDLASKDPQGSDFSVFDRSSGGSGYGNTGVLQRTHDIQLEEPGPIWLYCDDYGAFFSVELPLPWEVIEP